MEWRQRVIFTPNLWPGGGMVHWLVKRAEIFADRHPMSTNITVILSGAPRTLSQETPATPRQSTSRLPEDLSRHAPREHYGV